MAIPNQVAFFQMTLTSAQAHLSFLEYAEQQKMGDALRIKQSIEHAKGDIASWKDILKLERERINF